EIAAKRRVKCADRPRSAASASRRLLDSSRGPDAQDGEERRKAADREPGGAPGAVARGREQPRYARTGQEYPRASPAEVHGDGTRREVGPLGKEIAREDAAADEDH